MEEGRTSSSRLTGCGSEKRSTPEFQPGKPERRTVDASFFTVYGQIPLNPNVRFNGGLFPQAAFHCVSSVDQTLRSHIRAYMLRSQHQHRETFR